MKISIIHLKNCTSYINYPLNHKIYISNLPDKIPGNLIILYKIK